jgi:hypothetical protein
VTIDKDEPAFIAAPKGEDELGMVVRAHIYVEARLLELLRKRVIHLEFLDKMRLGYAQRVDLAFALGLKQQYAKPLHALGTLRNAFAHEPETHLTKDRVDGLYKTFSAQDKSVLYTAYVRTKEKTRSRTETHFRALPSKDQFILIAVTLRSMLTAAMLQTSE